MKRSRQNMRILVVALGALLTGSLVGVSGFVLCLGADGHRAFELEHGRTGCPTLDDPQNASSVSPLTRPACFDLPATGTVVPSSFEFDHAADAPAAFFATCLESASRLAIPGDARARPPNKTLHLISTVLLLV